MTYVSNNPSWWPTINLRIYFSHWTVAAAAVVVYDSVLTFGQEIELIWICYIGIPFSVKYAIGIADRCSTITYYAINGTTVALTAMLGVIMIARLHVMYQGSRNMLMFLVIIFLAVNIACGVIVAIALNDTVFEEFILSGIYVCGVVYGGDKQLLFSMVWMLNTVWEVLALCLSVWVAVKHFRELRRFGSSTGSTIRDCFRVLIQSHVLYFASFVGVSCLHLADLSPEISNSNSIGDQILRGALEILSVVRMFVLGPRLVLSVREYSAKLVAYSDAETSMNLIVFQEHSPTSALLLVPDAPLVPFEPLWYETRNCQVELGILWVNLERV
ncbi:uncharacterized protein F5147DRAFT_762264 [Suillus discolor]|uniref:DUF6533 domain-containing protein n=1 Tax=Suillus discolor TaxID=1912936 RepID=A0A9P7F3A6_9AGAM|nr:uncharacterized protein F5147DRAFT_762264 [Suillus discolor]KAG2103776.1 hypothetical protein F5147DRAFT_762264 [Suillus discolor]